jgi:hypothetical protein
MFAAILRLHTSRTVNEGMPQLHSLKFTKPTTNSSATTSQQAQYGLRVSNVGEHSSVPNAVGREPLGRALCASDNDLGAIVDTVAPHLGVMTNPHRVSYPPPPNVDHRPVPHFSNTPFGQNWMSKWFYNTSTRAATGTTRCGSFVGGGCDLLVVSYG